MLKFSLLFILLVTNFFVFSSEEVADQIDANTLQGLTKEAFVTTNDFDNLKLRIERIKSNAESCDGITSEAIIMLTPRQIVSNLWWSVQSIPSNSKFRITINRDPQVDLFFNYLIIRK